MELKEALLRRRSVRKFTAAPVGEDAMNEILHAAMAGPSACNKTPWEFYVVRDPDKLGEFREISSHSNIKAPLAIVVCGNLSRALPQQLAEYWVQDCSAATENILLRAADLGLGAVWCGIYPKKQAMSKIREILELPEKHIPLNIIYIGCPEAMPEPRDQYREERIHYV